jgi:defect-in-organelle-trafficking protein DotC
MDAISLEQLQRLSQPAFEQQVVEQSGAKSGSRLEALKEAAFGVGARGGLISESSNINESLDKVKRNLDTVYDFASLMIQGRVVPAVLTEARDLYTQGDDVTLRLSGVSYKVESQARFASRPPHWREYLKVDYGNVADAMPSTSLLPRNSAEKEVWQKAVKEGWAKGVEQADEIFQTNLNRLNRDYTGMVRYHVLALKGMVTMPVVAQSSTPIIAGRSSMSLDETLLRITALPEFNGDMKTWVPVTQAERVIPGAVNDEGDR